MTSDITLASSGGDSAALETIATRQAELLGAATVKTTALLAAAANPANGEPARDELISWGNSTLRPYLHAEADLLPPALEQADDSAAADLSASNAKLLALLDQLSAAAGPAKAGAAAAAMQVTLGEHFQLHSATVLPVLARTSNISLAELWGRIEAAVGGGGIQTVDEPTGSSPVCECGVLDDDELPELDVRTIPHAIRHATVFGALEGIEAGSGLVLVAHHDPLPLLAQIDERFPGAFDVHYLERGPEVWRLQFRRIGAAR